LQVGICGTDREILASAEPWTPPNEDFLVLGHECLACVVQVGADVAGFQEGDLVVPVVRRGAPNAKHRVDLQTFGTFTERGIVCEHGFSAPQWLDRPEFLLKVAPALTAIAVLAEPVSVAEKGINEAITIQQARLSSGPWTDEGPRVLVTGLGPIAFAAVLACRARQWPVTVYGRDPYDTFRADLATRCGAAYVASDRFAIQPDDVEEQGYDLILECTGSDEVMVQTSTALASRGVMVWLGSSRMPQPRHHNVSLMMRNAIVRNHVHIGSVNSAPRDFDMALAHLGQIYATQPQTVEAMITTRTTPAQSLWHYANREPQGIKVVLDYS
jgi:threonine dehydrogenase-like Zn-dependent dehydrogenase